MVVVVLRISLVRSWQVLLNVEMKWFYGPVEGTGILTGRSKGPEINPPEFVSSSKKFILIEKVKFHLLVTFPEKTWLQIPFGIVPTLVLPQHHMNTFERVHDFHSAIVDGEVELLVSPTHRSGTGKLIVLDQAREIPEKHE